MSDSEVRKIIDKLRKLRALSRARERVRQLERELYGDSAKPEDPRAVPNARASCAALASAGSTSAAGTLTATRMRRMRRMVGVVGALRAGAGGGLPI